MEKLLELPKGPSDVEQESRSTYSGWEISPSFSLVVESATACLPIPSFICISCVNWGSFLLISVPQWELQN